MPSAFNHLHIRCQLNLQFLQRNAPHPLLARVKDICVDPGPRPPNHRIPLDGILFTVRNAAFSGGEEEYVKIETKDLCSGVYCVD